MSEDVLSQENDPFAKVNYVARIAQLEATLSAEREQAKNKDQTIRQFAEQMQMASRCMSRFGNPNAPAVQHFKVCLQRYLPKNLAPAFTALISDRNFDGVLQMALREWGAFQIAEVQRK